MCLIAYCSFQKTTLIPGGSEALMYATLSGTIGVLVPFTSHEDHDFFQHLEMHMRSEYPPICGRDHLSYRSYYFPVKVIFLQAQLGKKVLNYCLLLRMSLMVTCVSNSTRLT